MGVQIQGDTGNVIATKGTYSGNVTIGGTLTYEDVTNVDSIGLVTARQGIEVGASPGVAASISVDGNMIVSGITTIGGDIKVGSGVTIGKDGHLFATGVTTSTTVKVGAAVTISESGIEASGIGITCANINGTQIGGRRNLIINGAMNVAQRGTSSTDSSYATVDRFAIGFGEGSITQAQVDLTSSDTPYSHGFRKAYKLTNSTASTAAAAARDIRYHIEAQDMATSGWNSTSSSSDITLSFWVRSSVAQTYYCFHYVPDSSKHYAWSFALSADTWTKVTKTISGASGVTFNNDTGSGMSVQIVAFYGTSFTESAQGLDAWGTWNGASRIPNMTTTWGATTNATFEVTGVQVEVGSQVTPFEHRSYGEEFQLCQRYYTQYGGHSGGSLGRFPAVGECPTTSTAQYIIQFPTPMRGGGDVTLTTNGSASDYQVYQANASRPSTGVVVADTMEYPQGDVFGCRVNLQRSNADLVAGYACQAYNSVSGSILGFSREL